MEGSLTGKNQLDSSSRFDTTPADDEQTDRQTDRQTDGRTHNDSIYRASIVSSGKKVMMQARRQGGGALGAYAPLPQISKM